MHTQELIQCGWGQKTKGYQPVLRLRVVVQTYHSKLDTSGKFFVVERPGLSIDMEEEKLLTNGTINVKNIVTNERNC